MVSKALSPNSIVPSGIYLDSVRWRIVPLTHLGMTEVAQQSKARRKEDFVDAFAPVIAEAVASAYKGATSDVQNKLRRVIDVWKDRSIFAPPIQEAIEARIQG